MKPVFIQLEQPVHKWLRYVWNRFQPKTYRNFWVLVVWDSTWLPALHSQKIMERKNPTRFSKALRYLTLNTADGMSRYHVRSSLCCLYLSVTISNSFRFVSPWHGQFLHSDVCPHCSGFGLAKMQQNLATVRFYVLVVGVESSRRI